MPISQTRVLTVPITITVKEQAQTHDNFKKSEQEKGGGSNNHRMLGGRLD